MKPMTATQYSFPVVSVIPLKSVIANEFRDAVKWKKGTEYFEGFNFGKLIIHGHPLVAFNEILRVLAECQKIDMEGYKRIHKGDPFYWLGVAAFLANDFETAVYFMDAAVSEDLRKDHSNLGTPACLFIQLRGEHPAQAAKNLVADAEDQMRQLIDIYNDFGGKASTLSDLSIDDIRASFLSKSLKSENTRWRSLVTALISFVLEFNLRTRQIDLVVEQGSKEPFLLHLFKGCLLFESLIKLNPKKPPKEKTLKAILGEVKSEIELSSIPNISANEFQDVINLLANSPKTIEAAIEITGKTRNTTGHSLGWEIKMSKEQYNGLYECIGVSCLHIISTLYRE